MSIDGRDELIRLDRVTKRFRRRVALDELSLTVRRGEILALLGPNGAGKSTALALILGHLRPTSGEVRLRDVSVTRDRRRAMRGLGVVLETPGFHEYLTGWENLELLVGYSTEPDPAAMRDAVRFVGLEERIHDRVRVYSHGMRQRLALAQALVPAPDVVLLDEPAEGLDPAGIATIHDLVLRLKRERGVTTVIATHLLSEVEAICDRVAILDRGRLVRECEWSAAGTAGRETRRLRLDVDPWEQALPILVRLGAKPVEVGVVELPPELEAADLVAALVREGIRVASVQPVVRTLADVYAEAMSAAKDPAAKMSAAKDLPS